ncbi:ATP-binding protein [Pseudomonas sp. GD03842]|uniref:ATP-binding protein n=1 Tax=Pseudomonas sp. GD03842 TaxID=2975385 RepID=UPI0024498A7A|nr:ATP-binding protein [Pseudomonas sp. GD03842]MDH0745755.1 ATP-binding protein [Pseudomonas sp. GD03842]
MTVSKFSPAPRLAETRMHSCGVAGHIQHQRSLVEQFDGSWKPSVCPACRWQALNNTPKDQDEYRNALAEDMAEDLNAALLATGITPRFRNCSFATYLTDGDRAKQRALNICRGYAEGFEQHAKDGRALMLLGEIGCGKTHLACAILQHIVRHEGKTGLIVTAESITQAVTDSFRSNAGPSKSELIAELTGVDLLVIDEVGFHTPKPGKDFTPSLLHEVIDARYQRVLPSVLVSNQTKDSLHEFIGPRAVDRLRENGGLLAPFTWVSARAGGAV